NTHYVGTGRNLSEIDIRGHRKVCVIGFAIGQKLFPFTDPINKEILVDKRKYQVIGVFDEKKSAMGGSFDNYVLIPVTTFVDTYGLKDPGGFGRSANTP